MVVAGLTVGWQKNTFKQTSYNRMPKKKMLIFISSFRESQHNETAESVEVDIRITSSSMERKAQDR